MTQSICLHCGEAKLGALTTCDKCGQLPPMTELALAMTDHSLAQFELDTIGQAIAVINQKCPSDQLKPLAVAYYLGRKWPKILEFDVEKLDASVARELNAFYQSTLHSLPSQQSTTVHTSPITELLWTRAMGDELQAQDDHWIRCLPPFVQSAQAIAHQVEGQFASLSTGSVIGRARGLFKSRNDRERLLAAVEVTATEIEPFRAMVARHNSAVLNGWSERTKLMVTYLNGSTTLLARMTNSVHLLAMHEAGVRSMIELDIVRSRQEYRASRSHFWTTTQCLLRPDKLHPSSLSTTSPA